MQKRAELMDAGYAILENFADPMGFSKKLLEKAELPWKYKRISVHTLMAGVHSMFPREEALMLGVKSMHSGAISNSKVPYLDRMQ